VPYADLSDFFYVWLRRSLLPYYPQLLGTVLVPKAQELVAEPFRHGGRDEARNFFEVGMGNVFSRMRETATPIFQRRFSMPSNSPRARTKITMEARARIALRPAGRHSCKV